MTDGLRDKRVTVFGLGRFGGGIGVARWLSEQGAIVTVNDRDSADALADSIAQLAGLDVEYHLGDESRREDDFRETDLVVTSPAVRPTHEYLTIAADAGVPVTTEICLFAERSVGKTFGVTGTKGKSTTATLLYEMLRTSGPTLLGGNIGRSLLNELPNIYRSTNVVLELSSYMLHWLGKMRWSPNVTAITMLGTDHVDWHGTVEDYIDAKRNIVRHQKAGDRLVKRRDALSDTFVANNGVEVQLYPMDELAELRVGTFGQHNNQNAQAAYLATGGAVSLETAVKVAAGFKGLPHRLEIVHEHAGVTFVNDSIATIPEAAVVAADAFEAGRVIQIVGGADKSGLDFSLMCSHLSERCKAVLVIGQIGPRLVEKCPGAVLCDTLELAVRTGVDMAVEGDIILLSPGTASYDQFPNFEHRGRRFTELARQLAGG